MGKISSYILSTYSLIFEHPLDKILNVGYELKGGTPIPSFEENTLIDLCSEVQEIFENENNVLELNGNFIIVGDIHGSFHDLLRIIKFIQENKSKVLFLGDYVDRGSFSLECITILLAMKAEYPDSIFLIRGNHEFDSLCSQYGFKDEIINYHNPKKQCSILKQQKNIQGREPGSLCNDDYDINYNDSSCYHYSESLYNSFISVFAYLPIAAIINNTTFCIHGGLGKKLDNIDNINKLIPRPIDNFEDCKILSDAVWSDPTENPDGKYIPNPRGRGNLFNNQVVNIFLKNNSLKRLIRAHECVEEGILKLFDDKCITVFSASSYDNLVNNKSGVLQLFEKDDLIKPTSFPPLDRLKKSETTYYKVQSFNNAKEKKHNYFSLRHPRLISSLSSSRMVTCKCVQISADTNHCPLLNTSKSPRFTTNRRQSYQSTNRSQPFLNSQSIGSILRPNVDLTKSNSDPRQFSERLLNQSDNNNVDNE